MRDEAYDLLGRLDGKVGVQHTLNGQNILNWQQSACCCMSGLRDEAMSTFYLNLETTRGYADS